MDNKFLISVKTKQYVDGQPESIELITEGEFYKEGDEYYAKYEESEISGMEGTKTTMKIGEDVFTILREGTTSSELVFKKGVNHKSFYSTPFGSLEVTVKPRKIDIEVGESGGNVKLEYRMETAGLEYIDNSLELNIRKAKN